MEQAKHGEGVRHQELLQNAVQQAQRLLTRVWEWLCSLFGYRWQAPAEHQVLYRLFWEFLLFCLSGRMFSPLSLPRGLTDVQGIQLCRPVVQNRAQAMRMAQPSSRMRLQRILGGGVL